MNRRRFLASTALASAGLFAASRAARALQPEQPAQALVDEYHAAREACTANSGYHAAILANVRAQLEEQQLSDTGKAAVLARATCPMCGCPISDS
jgi:hypothetical protein